MKGSKESKELYNLFIRYLFLVLISIPNLFIFYFIFTPLTIYPIFYVFSLFYETSLIGNFVIIDGLPVEFIKACIAGSAYYLLLILIFSTPTINLKKRFLMVLIAFSAFLLINLLRITLLILVFFYGPGFFDVTHKFFWYFMSTVFVVLIWFAEVKYFKIKDIPFYSDILSLVKKIK